MKKTETLSLSHQDILNLNITIKDCIEVIEDVLKEHGKKQVMLPPKFSIIPDEGVFFTSMPAYVPALKISGIKWVSRFPENRKLNIPKVISTLILNEMVTGKPLAVMEGSWVTAMRTGATAAITAKYFAKKDFDTISIIGAGVQSVAILMCLLEVCPQIRNVKLFRYKDTAERFMNRFSSEDLNFTCHSNMGAFFKDTSIVIASPTYATTPFVEKEWLSEGILALPIHHRGWEKCAFSFDKVVTDDLNQTNHYIEEGEFSGGMPPIYAELGEVILGIKKGRENEAEKIIAYNIGIAISDIALGKHVYEKALSKGVGVSLDLNNYDRSFWL